MKKALYSKQGKVLRAWLKQSRLEADLTMRELARLLDVPFQTIGKIENGERRLDVIEFVTYCQAIDIDPLDGIALISN